MKIGGRKSYQKKIGGRKAAYFVRLLFGSQKQDNEKESRGFKSLYRIKAFEYFVLLFPSAILPYPAHYCACSIFPMKGMPLL